MGYALPGHVSICDVGGALIFLDLRTDRYRRLPESAEAALRARLRSRSGSAAHAPALDPAVNAGLLLFDSAAEDRLCLAAIDVPSASLVERDERQSASARDLALVAWSIAAAASCLKVYGLGAVLNTLSDRRAFGRTADAAHALVRANRYLAARRLLPARPLCLLDSLAMHRFIGPPDPGLRLIIGVSVRPFSAHSWLQTPSLLLNETCDGVRRFTPILAI